MWFSEINWDLLNICETPDEGVIWYRGGDRPFFQYTNSAYSPYGFIGFIYKIMTPIFSPREIFMYSDDYYKNYVFNETEFKWLSKVRGDINTMLKDGVHIEEKVKKDHTGMIQRYDGTWGWL